MQFPGESSDKAQDGDDLIGHSNNMSPSSSKTLKIPLMDNEKGNEKENPANRAAPVDYGPKIKIVACLGLVFVQVFASTVMKLAQKNGRYSFSPQSSLVMSESIKTLMSIAYLFVEASSSFSSSSTSTGLSSSNPIANGSSGTSIADKLTVIRTMVAEQSSQPLLFHMLGLAALYCINNAIMFWLFARADPGSISLIKSGATVVSAILLYIWRHFKLSISQWLVIIVQMLGLVVAQYDACKGRSVLNPGVYVMLFISLLNSSVANVWNEHVIKSFQVAGLAVKNLYLYAFGAILNMVAFMAYRASYADTPAFFQGYGLAALGVVTSNAFIGIAINAVYKYADALVKNISTTTTTVILLIISAMIFAGRNDIMVFIGTVVVICGTFLYFLLGISEAKMDELQRKLNSSKTDLEE